MTVPVIGGDGGTWKIAFKDRGLQLYISRTDLGSLLIWKMNVTVRVSGRETCERVASRMVFFLYIPVGLLVLSIDTHVVTVMFTHS